MLRYLLLLSLLFTPPLLAEPQPVRITQDLLELPVMHDGQRVVIRRNQEPSHRINPVYSQTARTCPPFCVQPARAAPGVETVAELEVLDLLRRLGEGETDLMLVDSRTPDWAVRGTIPGSVNIPWTRLSTERGVSQRQIAERVESWFGARRTNYQWDFSQAKTLILFCNGLWCGQSRHTIDALLELGYPAEKLKWYRGGMQDWTSLGLTTVRPQR